MIFLHKVNFFPLPQTTSHTNFEHDWVMFGGSTTADDAFLP